MTSRTYDPYKKVSTFSKAFYVDKYRKLKIQRHSLDGKYCVTWIDKKMKPDIKHKA